MKRISILFLYIAVAINCIVAQTTIKGHILDAQTEEHLPGVVVKIEGLNKATTSDETGHFTFSFIPTGNHTLTTQYIGYKSAPQAIEIKKEQVKHITLYIYPDTQMLNEVSVVASAKDLNRQISTTVVNQLTTQTLEATNSTSLAQGLNYMPGLRVETNCQNCGTQEVRINGLGGQYSQILMDDQAVFSSLSQIYGLEQLPLNMIDQVEVVRGGGSVLYGANAIGGVLNIRTKDPEKNSYEIKHNLSLIDGKSADNNLSINSSFVDRTKTSGVSIFANMRNRNAWDANDDGFSEIGKNRARSIGLRSYLKPSTSDKITAEYHHISEYRRGGDNLSKPPHEALIAETTDYRIHSGSLGYTHHSNENNNKLSVHTSVQSISRDSYYGANYDLNGYGKTSETALSGTVRYEINLDKLLFMPAKFTAGFTQSYTNTGDTIHNRRLKQIINVSSLYAQNEWRNEQLTYTIGVRAEKHNKLSNINIIPRTSIRYKLADFTNLRASYSMGYRAPEIVASDLDIPIIGGVATITVLGENLKREYSHSINGGADFTFFNDNIYSYFLVEGFYTKINRVFVTEEVGKDAQGNMILMRKNGDGAYVYGVNIETTLQPTNWLNIQGGLTVQQSRYTEPISWSGESYVNPVKKMLRSPDVYGFLSATATKNAFSASLSGTYTGSMLTPHFAGAEGIDLDETIKTKDFIDVALKLAYTFNITGNKVEVNGGIQNIFNQIQKDYDKGSNRDSEYIYGPSLPRTYFVGLKVGSL